MKGPPVEFEFRFFHYRGGYSILRALLLPTEYVAALQVLVPPLYNRQSYALGSEDTLHSRHHSGRTLLILEVLSVKRSNTTAC